MTILHLGSQNENPRPRVFLSSTVYDLRDTRNVVSGVLRVAGFDVFQSDALGFPDIPKKAPYASCLTALEQANLVIAIVGKRYGQAYEAGWPYATEDPKTPTWAEIVHAYVNNKRLLVYIDTNVLSMYQTWRIGGIKRRSRAKFQKQGYDNVEGTMSLVRRLKALGVKEHGFPIAWIVPFTDALSILEDLRGKFAWDLDVFWRKFEKAEEERMELVLLEILEGRRKADEANLRTDVSKAFQSQLGSEYLQAEKLLQELQGQIAAIAEQSTDTDPLLHESLKARIATSAERASMLKRQFLLEVVIPQQTAAQHDARDSYRELSDLMKRVYEELSLDRIGRGGYR